MRHFVFLAVFFVSIDGFIKCRSNDKGSDEVRVFSSDYCGVKQQDGRLIFTGGTKQLCSKTTSNKCFKPSSDVLCCKGDFCNANLKSTDCATFNPPKCPTGNGNSPTELRNCPTGTKYCHYAVFTKESKEIGFKASCAPPVLNTICKKTRNGCMNMPLSVGYLGGDGPVTGGYECCKPVEVGKNLAMDWGRLAIKEDLIQEVRQHELFH